VLLCPEAHAVARPGAHPARGYSPRSVAFASRQKEQRRRRHPRGQRLRLSDKRNRAGVVADRLSSPVMWVGSCICTAPPVAIRLNERFARRGLSAAGRLGIGIPASRTAKPDIRRRCCFRRSSGCWMATGALASLW